MSQGGEELHEVFARDEQGAEGGDAFLRHLDIVIVLLPYVEPVGDAHYGRCE